MTNCEKCGKKVKSPLSLFFDTTQPFHKSMVCKECIEKRYENERNPKNRNKV
jgi:hypothetical protein